MRAKIRNGSISHAQLIELLPDENAQANDLIAQDILKATSYLLNSHCKTTDISSKECVKFLSKYSLPESRLTKKCLAPDFRHRAYRRLLPPSYQDGLQKVRTERRKNLLILIVRDFQIRTAISGRELPGARFISNVLFTSGLENIKQQSEAKLKPVTEEGILDRKLSLSVAQWAQFLEHDLSKTVVRSVGTNRL